jgi:LmbE family N-acetylglucosaminyl deacetylase
VRHDPDGPTIVLSPHLDDAVLCAFTVLTGPGDVLVVNVCDGMPPGGRATAWVRMTGGADNAQQMTLRLAEDRAAMAMVARRAIGLRFLDSDERDPDATPDEIAAALSDAVPAASRLLAPAAIGSHPDHKRTQAAALSFAGQIPVELYADMPYALTAGWPSWVSGAPPDPHVVPEVRWERALARVPVAREALVAQVVALDADQRAAKARALDCYATQIGALAGGPHRRFDDDALAFEVRWAVTTPTG